MIDERIALVLLDGHEHTKEVSASAVVRRWLPQLLLPSSLSFANDLAFAISFHRDC